MTSFGKSQFVQQICKVSQAAYQQGWDERNGGNVSVRLTPEEVQAFDDVATVHRVIPLGFAVPSLAGQYFLVTGTGRYFRKLIDQPNLDLGLIRISKDGNQGELVWGLSLIHI